MIESSVALSSEQLLAVESRETSYGVRAGAGSGKTSVIVATYLHLVAQGVTPEQILALTFTRKAAAEMRSRIVSRLRDEGRLDAAQVAETGPIQTIDGFCERLLRELSIIAGVDPEFESFSEDEAPTLVHQTIFEKIAELSLEDDDVRLLANNKGPLGFRARSRSESNLVEQVSNVLSAMRSSHKDRSEIEFLYAEKSAYEREWQRQLLTKFLEMTKSEKTVAEEFGDPWVWDEVCAQLSTTKESRTFAKWANNAAQAEMAESLRETATVGRIACAAWRALDAEMERTQKFDFMYVARKVVRLAESSDAARRRIQRTYKVLLIDEAQDINPTQFRLMQALGIERNCFVGDPQQSIYLFRHADRRLFLDKLASIPQHNLTTNYRSREGILNFVERVFGAHWGDEYQILKHPETNSTEPFGAPKHFEGVEFWTGQSGIFDSIAEGVRQLIEIGVPKQEIAVLCRTALQLGQASEALDKHNISHRVVGGLKRYYARMPVRDLACALEALANPHRDYSLLCLLHGPIVGLSFDSVAALAFGGSVFERIHEFEPLDPADRVKLDEFMRWFEPLAVVIDRSSAWEAISEIFSNTPILQNLARKKNAHQNLANVRKLLQIAANSPSTAPTEFAERIRQIQRINHAVGEADTFDVDADVVTLMTVHKSKGLEFPNVVLPLFDQNTNVGEELFDQDSGLIALKSSRKSDPTYRVLGDKQQTLLIEEADRILYVAMTRAKKRLCVVAETSKRHKSPLANSVIRVLGDRAEPVQGVTYRTVMQPVD